MFDFFTQPIYARLPASKLAFASISSGQHEYLRLMRSNTTSTNRPHCATNSHLLIRSCGVSKQNLAIYLESKLAFEVPVWQSFLQFFSASQNSLTLRMSKDVFRKNRVHYVKNVWKIAVLFVIPQKIHSLIIRSAESRAFYMLNQDNAHTRSPIFLNSVASAQQPLL